MKFIEKLPNNPECQTCVLTFSYHELELMYEIAVLLGSTYEIESAIKQSMKLLKKAHYLERSALFVAEDSKLTLVASIELSPQQEKMAIYGFGEGATGLAAQSKETVIIENIHKSPQYLNKLGQINTTSVSYVAVPLLQGDEVLGVITAHMTASATNTFDDIVRVLTLVGSLFTRAFKVKQTAQQEKQTLTELKTYYKAEMLQSYRFDNIIGKSTKMQHIFSIIDRVAPTDATVLIRGETGTGKELIAAAIHNQSRRKNGPFIKLNCAAISETLLESELFGHEKGAFTDAREMRKGRFELADGGTLFLDEVGDVSPNLQVKLLRILQEQEFERVGGNKTIKVNVRLVAATNRNLEKMVAQESFREDLYYRLNVIPINLPPLRERYEDVKLLIEHYLHQFTKEHRKQMVFSKKALEQLLDYPWPGNIRELQNMIERIVLICPNGEIAPDMLNHVMPFNYQKQNFAPEVFATKEAPAPTPSHPMTKTTLQDLEKEAIVAALEKHNGIQTKAAQELGMTARQIGYKMRKYEIDF